MRPAKHPSIYLSRLVPFPPFPLERDTVSPLPSVVSCHVQYCFYMIKGPRESNIALLRRENDYDRTFAILA